MSAKKWIYAFGGGTSEGSKELKPILGGKGAGLHEMAKLGVPVPAGFTIITEACKAYDENNNKMPAEILEDVWPALAHVEELIGKRFGDPQNPLLISVRSGAAMSMPGMMDTILNLGLNDESVEGLAKISNNERFAWDSYRRFISMFGEIALDIEHKNFEKALTSLKEKKKVKLDTELTTEDMKELVRIYKEIYQNTIGFSFPNEPRKQLEMAIDAVLRSWNNNRAVVYRKINDIKGLLGTAVNVQAMVFGNMGNTSGTGVAFSRDPSTGDNILLGEFLMNAQGEDVVAGIRTPNRISDLEKIMPECYKQFIGIVHTLEQHYKDMQDVEFTIQEGKLYLLQCRNGKRGTAAALKIAVDLVSEGLITKEQAIKRIEPNSLNQLLHPQPDPLSLEKAKLLGKGLAASPGAACGQLVFTAEAAKNWVADGKKVILVRLETSPEDIEGMDVAQGILTCRGGLTSHAAVVCRGMGRCCVAGWEGIEEIDEDKKYFKVKGVVYKEGDWMTIIGTTGQVFEGKVNLVEPEVTSGSFKILMEWADSIRKLKIRTNADTPKDAQTALKFGAEGIGLCRTEHMFFKGERIHAMREMILSSDLAGRKKALEKLLVFQKEDFKGLFEAMKGRPVTIRLLDPPLHEFLPTDDEEIKALGKDMNVEFDRLKNKIQELHEVNPMLGHRGCRLGISYPEISEMQTRAILEAAAETGALPEIMVPLVGFRKELQHQKEVVFRIAEEISKKHGKPIKFLFGTMIEVPRGALCADEIALDAEFFSFGTNDLTQMGCGLSRDDAGKFLKTYVEMGILEKDPFAVLDRDGVGQLMKIAIQKGRATRPDMKIGICGEHGGEPSSIEFCHMIGLNYVSCSPYRVPIARLAAAHAALDHPFPLV